MTSFTSIGLFLQLDLVRSRFEFESDPIQMALPISLSWGQAGGKSKEAARVMPAGDALERPGLAWGSRSAEHEGSGQHPARGGLGGL